MNFSVLFSSLIELFLFLITGYILYKCKLFDNYFNQKLNAFILNATMPCLIIASVLNQTKQLPKKEVLLVAGISIAMYIILPIVSICLIKLFHFPQKQQGIYMFLMVFSNVGFMGFPVIRAIYGVNAVFYTAIFNIVFNVAAFTYGIPLIQYGKKNADNSLSFKKIFNGGTISSILAVVFYAFHITFPKTLTNTITTIGDLTVPLAMMLIGSTLATIEIKKIFNDIWIYPFTFIKQIVVPLLLFQFFRLLTSNELILGITFVMLLMPSANLGLLFANEYHCDSQQSAKIIFITTLCCMITIPFMLWAFPI